MKIDQKFLTRIDEILAKGEEVLATKTPPPEMVFSDDFIDTAAAAQWFASALALIVRLFGDDSHYERELQKYNKGFPQHGEFSSAMGVFRAVKEDYSSGLLVELRKVVEAEVFDDFLEQAQELLEKGYAGAAAVLGGSVLEDGLRTLCVREGIALGSKPKMDRMNNDLAKAGVYDRLTQKRITHLAGIRNDAAHGKWDEFCKDDVTEMLRWIRDFLERNFV